MEPIQNNPQNPEPVRITADGNETGHSGLRVILPILIMLILLAAGYVWYSSRGGSGELERVEETPAEGVEVEHIDLNTAEGDKLPQGLPAGIPVEEEGLKESYKADYTQHGVTQYTVSYESAASVGAKWDEYNAYLASTGYELDTTTSNRATGVIRGTAGASELIVVITSRSNGSYVQLNYIVRR